MIMRSSWAHAFFALLFAFASIDVESLLPEGEGNHHEHVEASDVLSPAAGHTHGDPDDHHEPGNDDCQHHVAHCCCSHVQPSFGARLTKLDLMCAVTRFFLASIRISNTPSTLEVLHVPIA
jgi:hypothetical protein